MAQFVIWPLSGKISMHYVTSVFFNILALILCCILYFSYLQMELCLNPDLIKKWKRMIKRETKVAKKQGELFDSSTSIEVKFLRNLIKEFLDVKCYLKLQYSCHLLS